MGMLGEMAMRKTLTNYLKMGREGLEEHVPMARRVLAGLSKDQLELYAEVLNRTALLVEEMISRK